MQSEPHFRRSYLLKTNNPLAYRTQPASLMPEMTFVETYWSADYASGISQLEQQLILLISQLHDLKRLVGSLIDFYSSNQTTLLRLLLEPFSLLRFLAKLDVPDLHSSTTKCLESIASQSTACGNLARTLQREVLNHINDTLKAHEPSSRLALTDLRDLLEKYEVACDLLLELRRAYDDSKEMREFDLASTDHDSESDESDSNSDGDNTNKPTSYPLALGTMIFKDPHSLAKFFQRLLKDVVISSRRIVPLPGLSSDIFTSEELCRVLTKELGPARSKLEKMGQALLDKGYIASGTLIPIRVFRAQDMWLGWLEKAANASKTEPVLSDSDEHSIASLRSSRRRGGASRTASFNLQGMLKNMTLPFAKKVNIQKLGDVEEQYNEAYGQYLAVRRNLETSIRAYAGRLAIFERTKIETVHKSLAKVLEVVYNANLEATKDLHASATAFIESINLPETYARDFSKAHQHFATGVYCPREQYCQNIRRQFDLFKDLLLQSHVESNEDGPGLRSLSLIPLFLYGVLNSVEDRKDDKSIVYDAWCAPLDHDSYWKIKEQLAARVAVYDPPVAMSEETAANALYVETCVDEVTKHDTIAIINFVRGWLLEITDSVIPGLVYDRVTLVLEEPDTEANLVKCLANIPRSNLASLLYIMEKVCGAADIPRVPGYGTSDFLAELEVESDAQAIEVCAKKLSDNSASRALPFMHLLLRPPMTKVANGWHPPLEKYQALLQHLMRVETRYKLLLLLIQNELNAIAKREKERIGLPKAQAPRSVSSTNSPSPKNEDFSLRPFRTKNHEHSEHHSPSHNRTRSLSASFTPEIDVEFAPGLL